MSNPFTQAKRIIRFLTHDIWSITNEDVRGFYRWLMNVFKAVYLSIRFFSAHRLMEKASALTYYTLLAIVPIFALLLGIGRAFGIQEFIRDYLAQNSQGHDQAVSYILQFAASYLDHATDGVIMGVGIVMLIWVIYSLMGNIENVMNEIWQQKHGRSPLRKVTDYLSIMILVPLFLLLSAGAQIFLQTYIQTDIMGYQLSVALLSLLRWAPLLLIILMFSMIYVVIPNCKVNFSNALSAGLVAGIAFQIFQWFFIMGQFWVSKNSAIYGSFAALPLLVLWIQASWTICLYGAELSYASQNIENYNFENLEKKLSRQDRDFLLILLAGLIYNRFNLHLPLPTTKEAGDLLKFPAKLTGELIRELLELGVINEVAPDDDRKSNAWAPAYSPDQFTIASLYDLLSTKGENQMKINYSQQFAAEWKTFAQMHQAALGSGSQTLLRDISFEDFKPNATQEVKVKDKKTNNKQSKKK